MKPAPLVLAGLVAALAAAGADSASSGALGPAAAEGDEGFPLAVEEVDRFDEPWAMAFLPDGDLLVTERSGTLHLRDADTGEGVEVAGAPTVVDSGQAGLGDVLPGPTYDQDGGCGRAGPLSTDGGESRLEGLEVIWRQTPKTDGDGHLSHRLAIAPDGEHLFVSSGDRQLGAPAQDTSNTPGTMVRLTLKRRTGLGQPAGGPGRGHRGDLELGAPQPARPRARARRDALVLGDGSGGRRRAEPGRGRVQLRVAGGVRRQRRRRRRDPRPLRGRRLRRPCAVVDPEHLSGEPDALRRRSLRRLAGRRVPRCAVASS